MSIHSLHHSILGVNQIISIKYPTLCTTRTVHSLDICIWDVNLTVILFSIFQFCSLDPGFPVTLFCKMKN